MTVDWLYNQIGETFSFYVSFREWQLVYAVYRSPCILVRKQRAIVPPNG